MWSTFVWNVQYNKICLAFPSLTISPFLLSLLLSRPWRSTALCSATFLKTSPTRTWSSSSRPARRTSQRTRATTSPPPRSGLATWRRTTSWPKVRDTYGFSFSLTEKQDVHQKDLIYLLDQFFVMCDINTRFSEWINAVTPPFMQITCHTLSTSSRFRGDQTCWRGWSSTAPLCSRFLRMTRLTPSSRAFLQPRNTKVKHSVCLFSGPCRSKVFLKSLWTLGTWTCLWSAFSSTKTSQMLPSCGWTNNKLK